MAHEFTSGVFAHSTPAWHRLGAVIDGTLPAREMFERAGALFPVEPLGLWGGDLAGEQVRTALEVVLADPSFAGMPAGYAASELQAVITRAMTSLESDRIGIWRPDTKKVLGTASPSYQIIPNDTLLKIAESLGDEIEMDTVVVLRDGAKVCFTANIKGASAEVIPGDPIKRNFIGYLGHDGKCALGMMLANTRVVCANTLAISQSESDRAGKHIRIRHNAFEIAQIDGLIEQIDLARQSLPVVVAECRAMADVEMTPAGFRSYIERVYQHQPLQVIDGNEQFVSLEYAMPRKWAALEQAYHAGLGTDINGVKGSLWGGFNAVTEVESSALTKGAGKRRMHSAFFGTGRSVIDRARTIARELAFA